MYAEGQRQTLEQDVVIDRIEHCANVKECEKSNIALVDRTDDVRENF